MAKYTRNSGKPITTAVVRQVLRAPTGRAPAVHALVPGFVSQGVKLS